MNTCGNRAKAARHRARSRDTAMVEADADLGGATTTASA
jgi:hypothetical protein